MILSSESIDSSVWVVIVCYNGGEWLRKCLESLSLSTLVIRIIVLDNGSTDNSLYIIESEFPSVKLIRNKENAGFGRANNYGIQMALAEGAEYIFLLNQDAWVEPNTITQLIQISKQNPHFGIISPVHLNGDGSALDHGFANYLRADKCPKLISDLYTGQLQLLYPLPFVNAAAWLITKSCLQKVGGFNPIFFMYGEDVDLCQRVLFHGLHVGVAPLARIYHARSNATSTKAAKKVRMSKSERIKQEAVDMAILTNINRSFIVQLTIFAGRTLYDLLVHSRHYLSSFLLAKWHVLQRVPSIIKSRRLSKKPSGAFIKQ